MFSTKSPIQVFSQDLLGKIPTKFTFPFNYQPHDWVKIAAKEVIDYLENQNDFDYKFGWDAQSVGKMIGILVVEDQYKEINYLAAFSGKINETNYLNGFVPPVFDILDPNGFFRKGEDKLNQINQKIDELEQSIEYLNLKNSFKKILIQKEKELAALKLKHNKEKKNRAEIRKSIKDEPIDIQKIKLLELENQSKQNHFELKDQKRIWNEKEKIAQSELEKFTEIISDLKQNRKQKSADIQKQLHQNYTFLNFNQEEKSLLEIFAAWDKIPPAGAGECAAPRLLQYAFKNKLKPIAMGEFWYGKSPDSEIREHLNFYPACKAKCEPILGFMLQGLQIEENPVLSQDLDFELEILYEDEFLLAVNKPAGILSVPGKKLKQSLLSKVQGYVKNDDVMMVHRLDMATSGIILIAKDLETYKKLQQQFAAREVKKVYTAILDGMISEKTGKINLPIRVDLENRPMQLVCYKHGKEAITYFQVVEQKENRTKILLYPQTGRTHQLRVHAAHKDGLHCPIVGDDLYGKSAERLFLHATQLEFFHPSKKIKIKLNAQAPY